MQPIDWTTDPVLRELFGDLPWRSSADALIEQDVAEAAEQSDGLAHGPIRCGLTWILDQFLESFAACGCAVSIEYHDPDALFAARRSARSQQHMPADPWWKRLQQHVAKAWLMLVQERRAVDSLVAFDERLLHDIGLTRDPADNTRWRPLPRE